MNDQPPTPPGGFPSPFDDDTEKDSAPEPEVAPGAAPPGYYPDPENPGATRYWSGAVWGPPTATAPPSAQAVKPPGTNGLAIASMMLGILGFMCVTAVLAVIFGHISLGQFKARNNQEAGRGMAIAGLVLGYVWLAFWLVLMAASAGSSS
jgi:hypothetical protein